MNTPITDAKSYPDGHDLPCVSANVARRLELDRASLMEALEAMIEAYEHEASMCNPALLQARTALAAARANFSEP